VPQTPSDLASHACLQMVTPVFPPDKWTFDGPNGEETIALGPATFQVNVAEAMAVAVTSGMGIGLIPIYSAISGLRKGDLVRLLPDYTSQEMNLYALYPSRQYLDAKIRTWIEHLRDELPATLAVDEAELRQFART